MSSLSKNKKFFLGLFYIQLSSVLISAIEPIAFTPHFFITQNDVGDMTFHSLSTEDTKQAVLESEKLFKEASTDRELFWAKQAQHLDWFENWTKVLDWQPPYAEWFVGGKLNACYNCLDRHLPALASKQALLWEGENGVQKALSYLELTEQVKVCAAVLRKYGVKKGDTVAIYMPLIPEAVISMLACARIGAIHTVIFGGFSADALRDRVVDAGAKIVITADGGYRRGKVISLKETVDIAIEHISEVEKVIVFSHVQKPTKMQAKRDIWYTETLKDLNKEAINLPPEKMEAEDPLYILYTSGTTGKPKGILHTTGGYMVGVNATTRWLFNHKPSDIYWCTADIGWVTGHSYVVYGPLSNGMTVFLYEGAPDWPQRDRFWQLIDKYKVTILYTAPTAIRTFMKWGEEWLKNYDLSSLRLLGSVGEPINPEAWLWYFTHIGKGKCPVIDTWWQTETGSIMIAPIPYVTPLKPGSATHPLPGIDIAIIKDFAGKEEIGSLAITTPWPSMLRGVYKNPDRYEETYWKKWGNSYYFTGDGARQDQEGYFWLLGRIDDVISVSGHRIGTMELESALIEHPSVAESAVIGIDHEIKGQVIIAFVILKEQNKQTPDEVEQQLKEHIAHTIGAFARPERIILIGELPKTRSGKIMRRLLRDIAEGRIVGDRTTLADPLVIEELKNKYQEE